MARPANPQRNAAISTISRLVGEHGVKTGLQLARKQFPNVPHATWARWRHAAVGNISEANAEAVVGMAPEVRAQIPALHELTQGGDADPVPATHRALNFWRMLDELEKDVQLMRDFALTKSSDGKIKLRVPPALRDAHRMRCDLIRLALQQAEVALSTERAAQFYQTIIDEIGKEALECQLRIMARLKQVQTEAAARGF